MILLAIDGKYFYLCSHYMGKDKNATPIFHLLGCIEKIMEDKPRFRPNPSLKLMDQVREVLRYHHYAYRAPRKTSFASFSRCPAGLVYWGKGVINQWLTLQVMISLPPTPHPVEVFRGALKTVLLRSLNGSLIIP